MLDNINYWLIRNGTIYSLGGGIGTNSGMEDADNFLNGMFAIISKLGVICFYMVVAVGGIKLAINLVTNIIVFFNSEDYRDQDEAKKLIKANGLGLLGILVVPIIMNFILQNLFGINVLEF